MAVDPSSFWYKGELGFFDNYIIPLAKKLQECNVFGGSSDEYLNYAISNRAEWAERGEEALAEFIAEMELIGNRGTRETLGNLCDEDMPEKENDA
jgi:hypothetical protein